MANSSLPLNCNDRPVFSKVSLKSMHNITGRRKWLSFVIAVDFFDFGIKRPLTVRTRRGSTVSFSVFSFCVPLDKLEFI